MTTTLEGLRFGAIEEQLAQAGVNPVHAKPLFNAVHRKLLRSDLHDQEAILPPLQRWLARRQPGLLPDRAGG